MSSFTNSPTTASPLTKNSSSATAAVFRRLVWDATVPLAISLDPADLPPGADRTVECFYTTAPRISYLPLILDTVRQHLVDLVLDESAAAAINEKDLWFEYEGVPLRWHWPIGLLYDYHTGNPASTSIRNKREPSSPYAGAREGYFSTRTVSGASAASRSTALAPGTTTAPGAGGAAGARLPWRLKLHLHSPPVDKLHSSPGVDTCRTNFMSMVKEADFVRWGSTKRVVNLRRQEQDALWEGVLGHDFEKFWSVAQKLVPAPTASSSDGTSTPSLGPSRAPSLNLSTANGSEGGKFSTVSSSNTMRPSLMNQFNESQTSLAASLSGASDAPSTPGPGNTSEKQSNAIRSIPMRIHLPDNAPIVQEPVAPVLEDGRPATLHTILSGLFPLLFPPPPSFSSFQAPQPPLAYPVIQGINIPLDAEIAWLGSTMASADGWVGVVIVLVSDADKAS